MGKSTRRGAGGRAAGARPGRGGRPVGLAELSGCVFDARVLG